MVAGEDRAGEEQDWLVVRVVAGPGEPVDHARNGGCGREVAELLPGPGESGSDDVVGDALPAENWRRGAEDLVLDDVVVVDLVADRDR